MAVIPAVALPPGAVILDGGMGQEIIRRGVRQLDGLWSASALIEAPDVVRDIHEDYIRAGARVITTNTYVTARARLADAGIPERFAELNRLAGKLAQQARDNCGKDVLIAGSLPPLYASYRPDLAPSFEVSEPQYREMAEILAPYVDLFLCETMSCGEEARAAASGAAAAGKPVWVSWTLADGGADRLRSGESVAEAAAMLDSLPVSVVLANCCAPESITAAMPQLVALGMGPTGGYANGFVDIPPGTNVRDKLPDARPDLGPEAYLGHVRNWVADGARIVGGCCEVGPAHIALLARAFATHG
jgi:S-methylmethionine-dependent homocysteine/selenocysteine methylase